MSKPVSKPVSKRPFPHTLIERKVCLCLLGGMTTVLRIVNVTGLHKRSVQRILRRLRDLGQLDHYTWKVQKGTCSIWYVRDFYVQRERWVRTLGQYPPPAQCTDFTGPTTTTTSIDPDNKRETAAPVKTAPYRLRSFAEIFGPPAGRR